MRNALHEQLLKAGLIDERKLAEVERERAGKKGDTRRRGAEPRAKTKTRQPRPPESPAAAPAPAAPSRAEREAARRALEREVVQIIKVNRRPHNDGDEVYNFVDGKKIGRIYCTAETHAALGRGELAIVRLRTRYAVVPAATAVVIAAKAPELVLLANPGADAASTDDPAYAEHPIPDDLRW